MSDDKKDCVCPFCNEEFDPDGVTAAEFLARGIITAYAEMQRKASKKGCASNLPCPRCGRYNMSDKITRNALSRHAEIYICDQDGSEEAIFEFFNNHNPLPLSEWWIVKEILSLKHYNSGNNEGNP